MQRNQAKDLRSQLGFMWVYCAVVGMTESCLAEMAECEKSDSLFGLLALNRRSVLEKPSQT